MSNRKRIVVLGAGFGGLEFCKRIDASEYEIVVIDRRNHHLFQPLLYQVATAGLSGPEIAQPIRSILHKVPNLTVYLDEVTDIRLSEKKVYCRQREFAYDYLVIAMGGRTTYFGNDAWEQFAPGLKTLDDAVSIRQRVLMAFEEAENTTDLAKRDALMTIVVIGGGPTGVEMAGAFAELARQVLPRDFDHIDSRQSKIILIEAMPRILGHLTEDLSASGQRQLEELGVTVRCGEKVLAIRDGEVELEKGLIKARTIFWSAGVGASPITKKLAEQGVKIDRAGRVEIEGDLSIPGHPEVFAIGDVAFLKGANGKPVPGVSPAALQMGKHTAKILNAAAHGKSERPAFKYLDKGTMATIGRSHAVAAIGPIKFSGFIAWVAWLLVHLMFLIGLRNRIAVVLQWIYSYVNFKRGSRIIYDRYSAETQGR
ncbi:MAG: NAD(P)/FAD-dependent oxidoreductase [Verrucomicrobium sp.]|nr:NAD(P)/FAD-dependent oxidoreductase [Verrucomicrobium sp.]